MPGVTLCKHAELGVEVNQPTDALAAFVARGWEPIGVSRSVEDANQERVDAENAAALHTPKPRITPVTRPVITPAGDAGNKKEH